MSRSRKLRSAWVAVLLLGNGAFIACSDTTTNGAARLDGPLAAVSGGTLSVKSANPNSGLAGQTNEAVAIGGTGFVPGAQASWQRNGARDTTITVVSTQYVS